jgi:hypothetical protein
MSLSDCLFLDYLFCSSFLYPFLRFGDCYLPSNVSGCCCWLTGWLTSLLTDWLHVRLPSVVVNLCPSCFDDRIVAHVYLSSSCFLVVLATCESLSLPLCYVSLLVSFGWKCCLLLSVVVALSLVSLLMLPLVAHLYHWFLLSCYDSDGFHLHSLSPRCYHWFYLLASLSLLS